MKQTISRPVSAPGLERSRLAQRCRRLLRGEVKFDAASRARYATDASIYQLNPIGVVVPRDETDVLATIDIANDLNVPVLPRGAGTSQCGQTVGEALVIDNSKYLRNVIDIDPEARTAIVEPGVVLDQLNAQLKPHGLWFPVDVSTSAQATIGGMAGNNSCGSRSIAYGNMVHNVLGIDAILADGTEQYFGDFGADASVALATTRASQLVSRLFEIGDRERAQIERMWPKVLRRVGGYNLDIFHPQGPRPYTADGSVNLAHMLVGSEGTLAYFKRIHLKLAPLPKHKTLAVISFVSFHRAMDITQHIVGLNPSAVELVDQTMVDLARDNPMFEPVIKAALAWPDRATPQALLLVEFSGQEQAEQRHKLEQLADLLAEHELPDTMVAIADPKAQKALWDVRKAGLNIMMSLRGDGKPVSFIEDCAVPLDQLAAYTDALTDVFKRNGTRGTWYAHASVGTLHVRPILDMRAGDASKMRAIAEEASVLVRRFKGAYSGEHGDGLVRSEWVSWQFGERLTRAFEEVKDLFDPKGLMNPGKIVRAGRMDDTSRFRFAPAYSANALSTGLDWSAWNVQNDPQSGALSAPGSGQDPAQGLAKAVEMCNNNGHCRKFDAGTMCPSFRITRDEIHSTRGRANTLRNALSGTIPGGSTSDELNEAMRLCVGCKSCRRECPTGVDMARMKIELSYQRRKKTPPNWRERLFAELPRYGEKLARHAWLPKMRDQLPGAAVVSQKILGIAAQRSMPNWRSDTFWSRHQAITPDAELIDQIRPTADVVLWVDTFTNLFDREVAEAAIEVISAMGYTVHLLGPDATGEQGRPLCCGRTYLSAGLLDQARAEARRSLDALSPWIERGIAVVGLEPSCLFSMQDEYLVLGLGQSAQQLAACAVMFETFVKQACRDLADTPFTAMPGRQVKVHGHCHQKSFDQMGDVFAALALIPELESEQIESSCCGMAGTFGYEADNYQASLKMAEQSLAPAVRASPADTLIVADGTSCRHQIFDTTGRKTLHCAQVLQASLSA